MDTLTDGGGVERKRKVYVESSVISYLTARDSTDVRKLTKQIDTRKWWNTRSRFDLFISQFILNEIKSGDPVAASLRIAAVSGIEVLKETRDAKNVTKRLVALKAVPSKAEADAAHIAIAAVHGVDFLVTWNQTHIANPIKRREIEDIIIDTGFKPPLLMRPDDLLETSHGD